MEHLAHLQFLATLPSAANGPAEAGAFALLFAFIIGHALADYPLQGKFLAIKKNRHIKTADYMGEGPPSLWVYCLTAHALVHAGTVWVILATFGLPAAAIIAFVEFVLHWIIDFAKCERWTNFHQDQAMHILCKIGYIAWLWQVSGSITGF